MSSSSRSLVSWFYSALLVYICSSHDSYKSKLLHKYNFLFFSRTLLCIRELVVMDSYSSPVSVKRKLKQILSVLCFKIREHDLPELKKRLSVFSRHNSSRNDDVHLSYALNFQDDAHLHHFALRSFSAKLARRWFNHGIELQNDAIVLNTWLITWVYHFFLDLYICYSTPEFSYDMFAQVDQVLTFYIETYFSGFASSSTSLVHGSYIQECFDTLCD